MFGRLVRSAFAVAAQQAHQYEQLSLLRSFVLSLGNGAAASGTVHGSSCKLIVSRSYSSASEEGDDACRANSHASASTSHHSLGDGFSTSQVKSALLSSSFKFQQLRSYGYLPPKRRFQLPEHIASLVQKKIRENKRQIVHPPPPTLEKRVMTETSKRVGCIATKAGMTQEWDEHGVRVPLTVLWIDECQVVGLKTQQVHGYTALIVGAGHRRQKCMPPSEAGFFLKAGVPLKKRLTEWKVSEDAMVPVGTHITAAHYVAGQRVDVTGWTKYKGFQGVMKRWGFKGLPASHGVSLTHRSPGAIGNRNDPGKIWKGKKLPGHMGNERRTVHHCLVYKVDAARNLVYIRGQVPGPVGHSILLRDSLLTKPAVRASWGLPFPTHIPSAEQLAASPSPGDVTALPDPAAVTVYANPKDPYRMYREETDYFPIEWKKGE